MKKQYKNTDKQHQVTEPLVNYQSALKIKIYHSFDEAKQDEIAYVVQQSPIERLSQTVNVILRAYGVTREELSSRKKLNQIHIIRTEQP